MDSLVSTLLSPRIGLRDLAQLSRRLAIALASGIEVRRVLERKRATRRAGVAFPLMREINDAVARGDTFTEGLARTGEYFPKLLGEMDRTSASTLDTWPKCFGHLADHYEEQLRLGGAVHVEHRLAVYPTRCWRLSSSGS